MQSTLSNEAQQSIRDFLKGHTLSRGVGNKESACSIAAINLALDGRLTDEIPNCMSQIIGNWIIRVQDSMPDEIRNGDEWRNLLPFAAGTGRKSERARLEAILNWYWELMPEGQEAADRFGIGVMWSNAIKARDTTELKKFTGDGYRNVRQIGVRHFANAMDEAFHVASASENVWERFDKQAAYMYLQGAWIAGGIVSMVDLSCIGMYPQEKIRAKLWKKIDPVGMLKKLIDTE